MATDIGVNVRSGAPNGIATFQSFSGTAHVAVITERGPVAPTPVYSLADFRRIFGERNQFSAPAFDWMDVFFRQAGPGAQAVVRRLVGAAAVHASATVLDTSNVATLKVAGVDAGEYGNRLSVKVLTDDTAHTFRIQVFLDGTLKDASPVLTSPTDAVAWGATSLWVTCQDLASATIAPGNNPAAITTALQLAGGADDRPGITDTFRLAALEDIDTTWGIGQVALPGASTPAAHAGLVTHAEEHNRFALLDLPPGNTHSQYLTLGTNIRAATGNSSYYFACDQWTQVAGVSGGTPRQVPPSASIAAVISQTDYQFNPNVPAAGRQGILPMVQKITNNWSRAERNALADAGVNTIAVIDRTFRLYGYRTGTTDLSWIQANNQRLRMVLTDNAERIGEDIMFNQIQGLTRGTVTEFKGALLGMLKHYYDLGALYGDSTEEAYSVDVSGTVNPPDTLALGILHALCKVKMSPFAERVEIEFIKYPITEVLGA